jgi:hypothetical protein
MIDSRPRLTGPCLMGDRQTGTAAVFVARAKSGSVLDNRPSPGSNASMIDPTRQEILARLVRLSELTPDMRFGQLVANLAFMAAGPWDEVLWDLEDEQLAGAMRQMEVDLSRRAAPSGSS